MNQFKDKTSILYMGFTTRISCIVSIAISCLLLFCSTTFGNSDKAKGSSNLCNEADTLLSSGHTEDAKKLYQGILASPPAAVCALEGLKKIPSEDKKEHAIGRAFEQAADLKNAREHYQGAIEKNPSQTESIEAYKKIREKSDPFNKVRIFDSIGDQSKAREAYEEMLKDYPSIELPKDLAHLREGGYWPGRWGLLKRAERELGAGAASLIIVVMKVICLMIPIWVFFCVYRSFKRLSLDIGDFKYNKEGENLGDSFVAYLKERYYNLQEGSRKNTILFISGPPTTTELPADLTFPTQIVWLKPVLNILQTIALAKSSLKLTGLLDQSGERPLTASLELTRGNKICSKINLRQEDFVGIAKKDSQANPISMLAEGAAIWLLFELQKNEYLPGWKKWFGRGKKKEFRLLGTKNWFSYTLFRAGQHAEKAGNYVTAKNLYVRALSLDNTFRSARVNLARLLWNDGDEKEDEVLKTLALTHIEKVIEETDSKTCEGAAEIYSDPSTYTAHFANAVFQFRHQKYADALKMTDRLMEIIDEAKKTIDPMDPELVHYLDSIKPMVQVVSWGLRVLTGNYESAKKEMIDSENENTLNVSSLLHHNLACSYSLCAEKASNNGEDCTTKALAHLKTALWLEPSDKAKDRMIKDAETDRSMEFIRTKTDFYRIRATYTPIAELSLVGVKYAKELADKCSVYSIKDLLQNTSSPSLREGIAAQLKVSKLLVERWNHIAGLSQIEGIGIREANFLDRAGVASTVLLSQQKPDELCGLLESLNKLNIGTITCDLNSITKWINEAKLIQSP